MGRGAGWPLHLVSMRKQDWDGVRTLEPIHVGEKEERGKKEGKINEEKSQRKEEEK